MSKGSFTGYNKDADEHDSQYSGKAFFDFVDKIPDETFPRKSLLMHSMGNHVVFDGACLKGAPKVQFENIFMVAAVRNTANVVFSPLVLVLFITFITRWYTTVLCIQNDHFILIMISFSTPFY